MKCTKCGYENLEGSINCINCKTSLTNQTQNQNKVNKKSSFKKILIICLLLLLIAGTFVGAKIFFSKSNNSKILIPVKMNDKYGYIDLEGNKLLKAKYDLAEEFNGSYAKVMVKSSKKGEVYQVINKNGKVKFKSDSKDQISYNANNDSWVINGSLYDSSLNKISSDDVVVTNMDEKYYKWQDKKNKKAGIMNKLGKITYTYEFQKGNPELTFKPSSIDEDLKKSYCIVNIENKKYSIVNCDTGKVIYDYTNNLITDEGNNVFKITTTDTYDFIALMYIQNDEVIYKTSNFSISINYDNLGYMEIYNDNTGTYSYVDIQTGKIVSEKDETKNQNKYLDDWEQFTKLTKFSCDSGYGLKSSTKEEIPCKWNEIIYLPVPIYEKLSSLDKKYVFLYDGKSIYLFNLSTGNNDAEFTAGDIFTYVDSEFIHYEDSNLRKYVIYNLSTEKSITIEKTATFDIYTNYIVVKENEKLQYYNENFDLIFSS